MPIKRPLKRDELFQRLNPFGIEILKKRGKGSEVILRLPGIPGLRTTEIFTIKDHGKRTEYATQVINAVLRRFGISSDDFWQ